MFETMETRRLLSFTANLNNGTLEVKSGPENSEIHIIEDNGYVHVFGTTYEGEKFFNGVDAINLWGNSAGDTLSYEGNTIGARVLGDSGVDYISINDTGSGASFASGGSGNDVLTLVHGNSTGSRTTLEGGSGDDVIYVNTGYIAQPDMFNYDTAECLVVAGSGDDRISTYAGKNTIDGGSGNDTVLDFGGVNTYSKVENVVVA